MKTKNVLRSQRRQKPIFEFVWVYKLITALLLISSWGVAAHKKTICLNMIVKNESPVIERCLQSVVPIIDTWVIVDTGSTDGTQKIIRDYLREIPGKLYERPWVDFGTNREEALQLAKKEADYLLFIDADDALVFAPDFALPELTEECYTIVSHIPGHTMKFPRLVKTSSDWHWHGILHEFVAVSAPTVSVAHLEGVEYAYLSGGARSRDPTTFLKDAEILEAALKRDPSNRRYLFYLAQSYECAGDFANALNYYSLRSTMGGESTEVFLAALSTAKMKSRLGMAPDEVERSFFEAYERRPSRAEPLYYLARGYNLGGHSQKAYDTAKQALSLPLPQDEFGTIENWIYEYGLLIEFSIAAREVGAYEESIAACDELLANPNLPVDQRQPIKNRRKFSAYLQKKRQ